MIRLASTILYTTSETGFIELDEAWILNFALNNGYTQEDLDDMVANDISITELTSELVNEIWDVIESDDTLPIKVNKRILDGEHAGFDIKEVE
jgi:hypothetical protein